MPEPIRPLPHRPDIEHDKKEAKALKRALAEGEGEALKRVRTSHPAFQGASLDHVRNQALSLRDAQLVIAREYGFDHWRDWRDFVREASLGEGRAPYLLARRAILRLDLKGLEARLEQDASLAQVRDEEHGYLIDATQSYANFAGEHQDAWSSIGCADFLLKNGSPLTLETVERAISTASTEMVRLFHNHDRLPLCLRTASCLGLLDALKGLFEGLGQPHPAAWPPASFLHGEKDADKRWPTVGQPASDLIGDAFRFALRHGQREAALFLLEQARPLDKDLGSILENSTPESLIDNLLEQRSEIDVHGVFCVSEVVHRCRLQEALGENDVKAFSHWLDRASELLTPSRVAFQIDVLEKCAYMNRPQIAGVLLDKGASVGQASPSSPAPESKAMVYAIDYGCQEMIALLKDLWPPIDDLPTAAGLGDLNRVRSFFDDNDRLLPAKATAYPRCEETEEPSEILLHAVGLAIMNDHLDVAEFLLDRGAPIDGRWGLHEPASLLHEAAANGKMNAVRFLVERGADVNIPDERFHYEAHDWAYYCGHDEIGDYLRPLSIKRNLLTAARCGEPDAIRRHLASGMDVDHAFTLPRVEGITALMTAVGADALANVEELLARGASVTRLDSRRRSPLHRIPEGAENGDAIARLLLAKGADPAVRNDDGKSAIDVARDRGLETVLEILKLGPR